MQARAAMLLLALSAASTGALAVRVEAERAPKPAAVREAASAGATRPDEVSALREGVITGLSPTADRVEVQGTWLDIAEGKTHIFRRGTALAPSALQKGMKIRFTLAPGSAGRGTLGVVYVP
jgi:hypothetical protein